MTSKNDIKLLVWGVFSNILIITILAFATV
jgi:hypothetical protein